MDANESTIQRKNSKSECIAKGEEELECAVCLQTCIHPVLLPCSHIFCFLCVKGIANQSKRCAMCRQEIPADFLDNPELLKKIEDKEVDNEGYQWFYEGRNGWWQYDERTSMDLENAFSRGQRVFNVLVAGFLYSVDFDRMVQQRRNDPNRRRRIKRDLASIPKKGVAGLKTDIERPVQEECSSQSSNFNVQLPPQEEAITESTSPEQSPHSRDSTLDLTSRSTPTSSELENLHLLHSDLHHNFLSDRAFPTVMRTTESLPGSLRGIDSPHRLLLTRDSPQYSTYTRVQNLFNDGNSYRPGSGNSDQGMVPSDPRTIAAPEAAASRDDREDIENVTSQVRVFTLDEENEYYSLDDTEEYDLPNDNEDL